MEKSNNKNNPNNTHKQQLFLKTKNKKIRGNIRPSSPTAAEVTAMQ
jgi:hypothetical protein